MVPSCGSSQLAVVEAGADPANHGGGRGCTGTSDSAGAGVAGAPGVGRKETQTVGRMIGAVVVGVVVVDLDADVMRGTRASDAAVAGVVRDGVVDEAAEVDCDDVEYDDVGAGVVGVAGVAGAGAVAGNDGGSVLSTLEVVGRVPAPPARGHGSVRYPHV